MTTLASRPELTGDRLRRALPPLTLLLPTLLVVAGVFAVALLVLAGYSVQRYEPGVGIIPALSPHNYLEVLGDTYYRGIVWRTVAMAAAVTATTLLLGYPTALWLRRGSALKRSVCLVLVLLPLLSNQVVRSYGWVILLSPNGVFNNLVEASGLGAGNLRLLYNWVGVYIGLVHITLPFMILTLVNSLQRIPADVEAAAATLGARRLAVLREVTIPLSLSGAYTGSVLVFTLAVGSFVVPSVLGGARFRMMAPTIHQQMMLVLDWPLGAALSFVMLAIVMLTIWLGRSAIRTRYF